jgi:hypothetical protein
MAVPDFGGVAETFDSCARHRITLIGQLAIAVDRDIAAPAQFFPDRAFARSGDAFDQIVPPTHGAEYPDACNFGNSAPYWRVRGHEEETAMRLFLAGAACALFATAAFSQPVPPPPPPNTGQVITMPVSAAPGETCAQMIARVRTMPPPADATKAEQAREELKAADAANDDASCRAHVRTAMDAMGGTQQ